MKGQKKKKKKNWLSTAAFEALQGSAARSSFHDDLLDELFIHKSSSRFFEKTA